MPPTCIDLHIPLCPTCKHNPNKVVALCFINIFKQLGREAFGPFRYTAEYVVRTYPDHYLLYVRAAIKHHYPHLLPTLDKLMGATMMIKPATPRAIIDRFYKSFHAKRGVIDIYGDRYSICMFIDGEKFKSHVPEDFWGKPIRVYDVRLLLNESTKMLHRCRDEKIDLTDPGNKQFFEFFAASVQVCNEVLEPKKMKLNLERSTVNE
jgi:hypothetical protein